MRRIFKTVLIGLVASIAIAAGEIYRMSIPRYRETVIMKKNDFFLDSPKVQKTLTGLQEGLFRYLEKIGWMHPYTMVWWCEME